MIKCRWKITGEGEYESPKCHGWWLGILIVLLAVLAIVAFGGT